jgi:glycosyltransferase involved in cell wall biosynthesis
MKIGLLLFQNVIGGIETISISLANLLQEQGHKVFFMFPFGCSDMTNIEIPTEFKVYNQPHKTSRITVKDMISFMANSINEEEADIIISMFLEESYILLKAKKYINKKFKLITMDHQCYCTTHNCTTQKKFWADRIFSIYNQSDALATIIKLDEDFYKTKLNIPVITIPNLPRKCFYTEINSFENNMRGKKILSIGRLVKIKGFDILIRAFSKIENTDWTLHIYGDGPEKDSLLNLIKTNGMENKIFLYPATEDVPLTMNNHEMFVFPSIIEPYGMALVEALLMGLPTISFNCPNGPAIIESELPGSFILVPNKNEELLAYEINKLMNDKNKRTELSLLARKYRDIINKEKILKLWTDLFNKI